MVFFENKQNDERGSTRLLGKETQVPSPSPDPFSCQKMQNRFYESGSWVQKNCATLRGHPKGFGPASVQFKRLIAPRESA
jgi:hypothetical protein